MLPRQTVLFKNGIIVFDTFVSLIAFVVTLFLRQSIAIGGFQVGGTSMPLVSDFRSYEILMLAVAPLWMLLLYTFGTNDFRLGYRDMATRYARAIAVGLLLLVTITFLLKIEHISRTFIALFGVVDVFTLVLSRYLLLESISFLRRKRVDGHRVVVVGCGPQAVAFAHSLRTQPPWNIKLLGHVCVEGEDCHELATPRIGNLSKLGEILDSEPIDEVLFAGPRIAPDILAHALNACDIRGVDVLLPLPPALPTRARVEIANLEGFDIPLLGLRRTPSGDMRLALKRIVDVIGALSILALALPVMLIVALAIKLSSEGPVFFRQVRAGKHGRKFVMYKFRSMVVDAETKKSELLHLNEMTGPVFKIRRDPRVTKVGSFLRRTSLDELPQLFNILFGDMSLVGPRPPLPSEVEQYAPWQRRRLSVKPGLTGLWQVSGRNNIDFDEWMVLDLRYIDNWSLWLDMKILFRTLPAVFLKDGAS